MAHTSLMLPSLSRCNGYNGRRILILAFSLSLYLVLLSETASAQWVKTKGPYGGVIWSLSTQGDTVFAATDNGIFRSFDGEHRGHRLIRAWQETVLIGA